MSRPSPLFRLFAVAAVAACALVPTTSALAAGHGATAKHPHPAKVSPAKHGGKHKAPKPKPVKVVHAVQGRVTALDAAAHSVTVTRHGSHHTTVSATVVVAVDARVQRNDQPAAFGDLLVGDHVSLKVHLVAGVLTATRVNAAGRPAPAPTTDPAPEGTDPAPEGTDPAPGSTDPAPPQG